MSYSHGLGLGHSYVDPSDFYLDPNLLKESAKKRKAKKLKRMTTIGKITMRKVKKSKE
jgi:hypothetical protein